MQHSLIGFQRLTCPIVANLAEEAMLNGIPFGALPVF
jgi:hypothetical protein